MLTNQHKHPDLLNGRRVEIGIDIGTADRDGYHEYTWPSGVHSVKIRRIAGDEENILTNSKTKDRIKPSLDLFEAVTRGLPSHKDEKSSNLFTSWSKILMDDFMTHLFVLRRLSYGDIFRFDVVCQNPNCQHEFYWDEDLSETEIFYPNEADAQNYRENPDGGRFDYTLPISRSQITYRLPIAADQRKTMELVTQDAAKARTEALRMCVLEMNGKPPSAKLFSGLPGADLRFLEQDMEKHMFGINTSITIECNKCQTSFNGILPLLNAGFLAQPRVALRSDGLLTSLGSLPTQNSLSESASGSASIITDQGSTLPI